MLSPLASWQVRPFDQTLAHALHQSLKLHPVLAQVLVARGVHDEAAVQRYLTPRLADLSAPAMADMDRAVERLGRAVAQNEHVASSGTTTSMA